MTSTQTVTATTGSTAFSAFETDVKATPHLEIDRALGELEANKDAWVATSDSERLQILDQMLANLVAVSEDWVAAGVAAKGIDPTSTRVGEEWGAITALTGTLRGARESQRALAAGRLPETGPVRTRDDGQLVVNAFPCDLYDRMFFPGVTVDLWLDPELGRDELEAEHRRACEHASTGKVTAILGAGNVGSLGPGDIIHKMFVEDRVVIYKSNPVLAYLTPFVEKLFAPLVERGFLRIIDGGAAEGNYIVTRDAVDDLHMTGSDKTYEAIVFGAGEQGRANKAARSPINTRPFSCELGNLSPAIVVPGPWSASDIAFQGEHIASTLTFNAGFNCLSTRVIVQHRQWQQREALLDSIRDTLRNIPSRLAYYPGAREIHAAFLEAHPDAETFGDTGDGHLPWTLIADVDATNEDEICFSREAFCSLFAETALDADTVPAYIDRAVELVNDRVWGTLSSILLVHPASLRDPDVRAAVERAIANLRYGTIGVNIWGINSFLLRNATWGAFPGHPSHDIQSGRDVVNNGLRLPRVQKSVIHAPFRQRPKPAVFVSHRNLPALMSRLVRFQASPSMLGSLGVGWAAMRG